MPGVIELGVARPGAVKLTEPEGTGRLPVKILDNNEGKSVGRLVGGPSESSEMLLVDRVDMTEPVPDVPGDESPERLVGNSSEGSETLPLDRVGSTDPILDVPGDGGPERLVRSDVGAATEVASSMRLDALKVPVVYTVTVYDVYDVIVTEPSQIVQDSQHLSVVI